MGINREHVQLWVEALESGEFEQGRNQLRNSCGFDDAHTRIKYNYCCLGVAVEVALRNGYVPQEHTNTLGMTMVEAYDHMSTVLWPGIAAWYGFNTTDPYVGLKAVEAYNQEDERHEGFRFVLITDPGSSVVACCIDGSVVVLKAVSLNDELSATQANDNNFATFQQIAAGLRAKYLTGVPGDAE